jgi:hypothetical protein
LWDFLVELISPSTDIYSTIIRQLFDKYRWSEKIYTYVYVFKLAFPNSVIIINLLLWINDHSFIGGDRMVSTEGFDEFRSTNFGRRILVNDFWSTNFGQRLLVDEFWSTSGDRMVSTDSFDEFCFLTFFSSLIVCSLYSRRLLTVWKKIWKATICKCHVIAVLQKMEKGEKVLKRAS